MRPDRVMSDFTPMRSIAITTYFAHHASFNGYKQILKYTQPQLILGVDERNAAAKAALATKYPWLHEWHAWRAHRARPVDVVHLLYAETYLRFSPWIFRIPVVGTFHQPPDRLLRQLEHGDETGRVSAAVHALTKGRYRRLAAAIILSENQREVLARFVPADRIHLVPLGAATHELIAHFDALSVARQQSEVLTVGNWLRDWRYYFDFVRACQTMSPPLHFVLVNRNLPTEWHAAARSLPNMQWRENLSDQELLAQYARASAIFLPLREATGNNAVNEAMAAGCPIVTNVSLDCPAADDFIVVAPRAQDAMLAALHRVCGYDEQKRAALRTTTRKSLAELDWSETARRTLDVYRLTAKAVGATDVA